MWYVFHLLNLKPSPFDVHVTLAVELLKELPGRNARSAHILHVTERVEGNLQTREPLWCDRPVITRMFTGVCCCCFVLLFFFTVGGGTLGPYVPLHLLNLVYETESSVCLRRYGLPLVGAGGIFVLLGLGQVVERRL